MVLHDSFYMKERKKIREPQDIKLKLSFEQSVIFQTHQISSNRSIYEQTEQVRSIERL